MPVRERPRRQAAVERALETGWKQIGRGALAAVLAAVRWMEDEPLLNAGIGAVLNRDGFVELDAGVMEGTRLRAGAAAAVRDVRHPVDLAHAILRDGRHVLLVGPGASRFAREQGVEICDPVLFITERQKKRWERGLADTVGAVARDRRGRLAAAASTGGVAGKLPGRVGDSPLVGAGFYADDRYGAACATGRGEGFMRLVLCHLAVVELAHGMAPERVAQGAIEYLELKLKGRGGLILVGREGEPRYACNTPFMPVATRVD